MAEALQQRHSLDRQALDEYLPQQQGLETRDSSDNASAITPVSDIQKLAEENLKQRKRVNAANNCSGAFFE